MARSLLLLRLMRVLAPALLAVAARAEYGARMPAYDDEPALERDEYHALPPDSSAPLDYKYEEDFKVKTELSAGGEGTDSWQRPDRKKRKRIDDDDDRINDFDKFDRRDDDFPKKISNTLTKHRPRHKSRKFDRNDDVVDMNDILKYSMKTNRERSDDRAELNSDEETHLDKDDFRDERIKSLDSDDNIPFPYRTSSVRAPRRRPRDRFVKKSDEERFGKNSEEDRYGKNPEEDKFAKNSEEERFVKKSEQDRFVKKSDEERFAKRSDEDEDVVLAESGVDRDLGMWRLDKEGELTDRRLTEEAEQPDRRLVEEAEPPDRLLVEEPEPADQRLAEETEPPEQRRLAAPTHRQGALLRPRPSPPHRLAPAAPQSDPDEPAFRPLKGRSRHRPQSPYEDDEYNDYYDMKRVLNVKNKLVSPMRRTQAWQLLVPSPSVRPFEELLSNRRMLRPTSTTTSRTTTSTSTTVTPKRTSTITSTTTTGTTGTPSSISTAALDISALLTTSSNGSLALSLAEKSRLSILKKAQRKEDLRADSSTKKPPVLMQVTSRLQTVVMVEPPSSAEPWMRARLVEADSPMRLRKVKRLMRHKLLSSARSIHDLTDNWDDLVCDYVDMSLVDSRTLRATEPFPALVMTFVVLIILPSFVRLVASRQNLVL